MLYVCTIIKTKLIKNKNKMETKYNRAVAIEAIKRLAERQNAKKDVVFQSVKEKKREERERRIKEMKKELKK